jgi:hypothetical protein
MNDKIQLIKMLTEEFKRWEELLSGISTEQITAPDRIANMSIKDIIAHLTAWQQITVARLEAAQKNRKPRYLGWPPDLDIESDDDLDQINAWIYTMYQERPWSAILKEWQERYLHVLILAQLISEENLLSAGKYAWLKEYPLSAVLLGTYEHHEEHREPLLALLHPIEKM